MKNLMMTKVENYIREHQMTASQEGVLVALSGGADSVCLLLLLNGLKERLGIRLYAFHLHHGLRGEEADRDEQFVRRLCAELAIPLAVAHRDVAAYAAEHKLSEEEAGRKLRYQLLEEETVRTGAARIAVAHHRDDSAETILYNLFRGTGLKGLGGIEPVRGKIIRPLLCVGRSEILDYLDAAGASYCTDSTNLENDYARNRIRNQILPLAAGINDRATEHILQAGAFAAQADACLQRQAKQVWQELRVDVETGSFAEGSVAVDADAFLQQEMIMQGYIVRRMLEELGAGLKDISQTHIRDVCCLAERAVGSALDLPEGLCARRGYGTLILEKQKNDGKGRTKIRNQAEGADAPEPAFWNPEMEREAHFDGNIFSFRLFLRKKDMEFPENRYTKWFDYDKIKGTLCIRNRQAGDYISLSGGGHKTLKAYMVDEKIPQAVRGRIPVLAEDRHLLWIVGYRMSEYYKISEKTKQILEVSVNGGESHG